MKKLFQYNGMEATLQLVGIINNNMRPTHCQNTYRVEDNEQGKTQ